jgi:hypothetical protein
MAAIATWCIIGVVRCCRGVVDVWLMKVAVRTQATPACVHCSSLRPPPSTTGLLCQRNMRIREGDYAMCFPKQRTWTVSLESAGPLAERGLGWAGRFALCVPASAFSESWAAPFVSRHAGEVRPDAGTGWNWDIHMEACSASSRGEV